MSATCSTSPTSSALFASSASGTASAWAGDLLDIPYQLGIVCIVGFGHRERVGRPHDEAALLWERVHIGRYRTAEIAGDGQVQA